MNARSPNAMGLCSRNILANELVRDSLTSSRRRLPNACQHMRSENLNGTQTAHTEILSIRVHCLALGSVDLTSSAGKLTMGVINAFAQWPSASSVTSEPYSVRVRSGPIPS